MRSIAPILFLALLGACSASLRSSEVAQDSSMVSKPVDGIPYRVRDRLQVEVYRKTDSGYERVGRQLETLADPSRLYVLNFKGMPLADSSVKLEQRADGSLSTVKLGSTGKTAETATSVASGIDALATANRTLIDAAAKAETTAATQSSADVQAALDAVQLRDQVTLLQMQLSENSGSLKPSEIFAAESAIRLAKMKANTAAVKAGQAIPFPDLED